MKFLLTAIFFALGQSCFAQLDSLNSYYTKGIEASKSGDSILYFHYFDLTNKIRPNHPTLLYHLANSAYLIDNQQACLSALINLVKNNVEINFEDEAYMHFKTVEGFAKLTLIKEEISKELNDTSIKLNPNISDHIESVAYDSQKKTYYFGSVNTRSIWKLSNSGITEVIVKAENNEAMYAVMGMVVDVESQILWACTAALPQMSGYIDELEGYSSILKIDLKTYDVIKTYPFNKGNTFGDIKLKNGIPYVSDGSVNNIYYLAGDEFTKLLPEDNGFINMQGIDFNGDIIIAADYVRGLYQINLTPDVEIIKMEIFGNYPERGIDGVYSSSNSLFLTQNGTNPMRVLQMQYNKFEDGLGVIIQNNKQLNEPTQGVIVNDKFLFIANSAWGNYTKENVFRGNENGVILLGN